MANCCIIDMKLETETAAEAEELREELQASFDKAEKELVGAYFGNDTRYLFDAQAEQKETTVCIGGWVKWGYNDAELLACLNWLRGKVTVKKMNMRYKVFEDPAYGEYDFDGEAMRHSFLRWQDIPSWGDEELEDYLKQVEEVYRNKKVSVDVPMG